MSARVRIGTVAYLNAAPLTAALDPARYEVVADHPRAIAAALAAGEVEAALIPAAAALSDADYRIVPGWCVGADGPVASVVLAAETPPEAWTEVVLDGTSRTSVTLARLLLTRGPLTGRVRADLQLTDAAPGEGPRRVGGTVAAVVIGDPARALPPHLERHDLAELWRAWTGHPFVFAVWAARPDLSPAVQDDLRRAGRAGVDAVPSTYEGDDRHYLTHHIRHRLDERALIGLRRFAALAHADGLVGTADVQLFGPATPALPRPPSLAAALAAAAEGDPLPPALWEAALTRARAADLLGAAHLRRVRRHGATAASYLPADHADAADPGEAIARAALEDRSAVVWRGLDALSAEAACALLQDTAAAGLGAAGLDAAGAEDRAQADGVDLTARLRAFADAGLTALTWDLDRPGGEATVAAAVAAGLAVEATLGCAQPGLLHGLQRLRAAPGPVLSLRLRAQIPAGSHVEPGRATPTQARRAVALARLAVDVPHLSLDAATADLDGAQVALAIGADDLGPVGDGATGEPGCAHFAVAVEHAERALQVGGLDAVRRDLTFRALGGPRGPVRRVRPVAERASPA
jgi:chorismate dehydratase